MGTLLMIGYSACVAIACMVTMPLDGSREVPPQPATPHRDPAPTVAPERRGDPFYTSRCANCDQERSRTGKSTTKLYDGRELRFCTPECQATFENDFSSHVATLDARLVADQLEHYPITTSIVGGGPLPAQPLDVVWNNRVFRLADETERAELLRRPEHYLDALDIAVIAAQAPIYGPTKCLVQGDYPDPDSTTEVVIGNRMIRLCCQHCVKVVRQNPCAYIGMVDYANREAAERRRAAEKAARDSNR